MTDITAFLTARLDETQADAEAAQAVDPAPWIVQAVFGQSWRPAEAGNRSGHSAAVVVAADGTELWAIQDSDYGDDQHAMAAPTSQHVARHDPARVLAEVKAKRRILHRHRPTDPDWVASQRAWHDKYGGDAPFQPKPPACAGCGRCGSGGRRGEAYRSYPRTPDFTKCPELRDLAAVYADHPDYDPAWRVE